MLNDTARDEVIRKARKLLDDFNAELIGSSLPPVGLADFFRYRRRSPSLAIEQLFAFVLGLRFGGPTRGVFRWRSLNRAGNPKAPAWLLYYPPAAGLHSGFGCIGLDPHIRSGAPYPNECRLVNLLCLHEIGHAYLHWDPLFANYRPPTARFATAHHEAEAWCFAFAFVMFCAEQTAKDYRSAAPSARNNLDHVWELISRLQI